MKSAFPPSPQPVTSSRIAVASWSLSSDSPEHLLRRVQQLGLAAVQVDLSQVLNEEEEWGQTIQLLRDAGIWVVSGRMSLTGAEDLAFNGGNQGGGILNDARWYANRFHAEQIARVADRFGVQLVTTQIGQMPGDCASPIWAKLLDRLGALTEIFAHYGIKLALETGQVPAELLDQAMDQLNVPTLGVNFDPAGIIQYGQGDPIESLRRLAPRVMQAHIRNALPAKTELRWGRETPIGRGGVPWEAFFEIALAIQPPIQFVIERDPRLARDEEITAARDLIAYYLTPRRVSNVQTSQSQMH